MKKTRKDYTWEDQRVYDLWKDMMRRCYNEEYRWKNSSYAGCSVCEEWHVSTNFKDWVNKQDCIGKELDKDILMRGNKVYSPETCVFIDKKINVFLVGSEITRGNYPVGVDLIKRTGKFRARCWNNNGSRVHIGLFTTPEEAHEAWRKFKYDIACKLADEQTDLRVAEALRRRYL